MRTFSQFIKESDDFVLAWNQYTAQHPKESRPIPVSFKRFTKVSTVKPPAGYRRGCWFNALDNYHEKGWKVVGGFAIEEDYVQKLLKTGEVSWNPLFRGYEHAWNLDDDGAVIDSTYPNPKQYRYYGMVVPEATLAGFGSNSDELMSWVGQRANQHDAQRHTGSLEWHYQQKQKPVAIEVRLPAEADRQITAKGFKLNHMEPNSGDKGLYRYTYLNRKTTSKMYVTYNIRTKAITVEVEKIPEGGDAGRVKHWNSLESYLSGSAPDRIDH